MKRSPLLLSLLAVFFLGSCNSGPGKEKQAETAPAPLTHNVLTAEEKAEGWVLLFDGSSAEGWKNYRQDSLSGWIVEDGCLVGLGLGGDIGGDIVTRKDYANFILEWDWKLGPHGNSGVMYHVVEVPEYHGPYETGPEYQLIDDENYLDGKGDPYPLEEWQKTAADYAMHLPDPDKKQFDARDWNSSRILFTPEKVEHWLNGEKVLEFVPWDEAWHKKRNSGKWDAYPDYGFSRSGKICLQDHGSKVWFRNIRIKEL